MMSVQSVSSVHAVKPHTVPAHSETPKTASAKSEGGGHTTATRGQNVNIVV